MTAAARASAVRLGVAMASCLMLVGGSILFLDRPVAFFMDHAFGRSMWLWPLAGIGQFPLSGATPALAAAVIAATLGWRPGGRGWTVIACALAVTITIAFKDQLKQAFGRTWPETWVYDNPSLIPDNVYGFSPFHGGVGWSSFPSGHTAAISAVAGVLWWRLPRLRWLWALLVVLTAAGLVGADIHFLADVIAGAYLGFACGAATLLLPIPPASRRPA
jgi:membrane-associated phospholipid phosphatase